MYTDFGTWVALSVLGVVSVVGLALTWLSHRAVCAAVVRPAPPMAERPPVSVLKPVKGIDDGLADNLRSLFQQRYVGFEILVGARDADDPALVVARAVAAEHPHVPFRAVICADLGALNPKVNLLQTLSVAAAHDLVLISDSNVRVRPDYLGAVVDELARPGVGLVTNVVVGVGERSVAALLENVHLVSFVARATISARAFLGRACVVGKSMLFRLSEFRRLGGWAPVRDVLAEDYLIGQVFQQAGREVALSHHVIATYNRDWSIARFLNRHLRWAQMRRRVSLPGHASELFLSPIPALLAFGVVAACSGRPWLSVAGLMGITARVCSDLRLVRRLRGVPAPWFAAALIPVKDLLASWLWVQATFRRSIDWRGNRLLIGRGTRLTRPEVAEDPTGHPMWRSS